MVASRLWPRLVLVPLAVCLAVLSAVPGFAADREEGDLRLRGGGGDRQPRLQVYFGDRWGAVCDDGFGQEEADVACRQLGYPEAETYVRDTGWSSSLPIWLDDVVCDGTEDRLVACSRTAWGNHNCSDREHVRVRCKVLTETVHVLVRPKSFSMDEDTTATYSVWLGKEPTGDVTVAVGGTIAGVTASPASLTFTTTDWDWDSRKTVMVSAADDLDMADESVTLIHTPSGGGYGDATTDEVSVTIRDDDIPSVAVDRQVLTIDEGNSTGATYAMVLTGRPSGSVTVTVDGHSGTDVSVQPATLTFGTMDWITPKTVTVTAAADGDKASETVTLAHSASGGGYDALAFPAVEVRVQDDDVEVAANPTRLTVDENGTATYTLRTDGGPWDSLTVAVEPPADSGFTVSPTTVTFTASDWDSPKTIRVAAQRDDDWSDDTWTVVHSAQGSGPGTVPEVTVAVTVDDLGSPGALIDDGGIVSLDEGSRETYRIRLMRNPRGTATVTMQAPSRLGVTPSSLSFDSSNWSQSRAVTIEALQDSDSADDTVRVHHRIAQDGLEASLGSTQVRITDDDDGESLIGSRPEAANVWWAALTPSLETGGVVGHIDYREPFPDTGKLSDDTFTYDGIGREIDAVYLDRTGHFQIWVDSGNGSALPNDLVLHVGSASMTLGSATQQSFGTSYSDGMTPMVREHTYWWQAGSHSVSVTNRQAIAVWLEEPDGTRFVPGIPQDVEGTPGDGKVKLKWEPPPGNGTRSAPQVLHYEVHQEGTEDWIATDGPETTQEVPDLVNGESYRFRVRAVNAQGKGAASAASAPVTPAQAQGLTGEFVSVPASHDGSSAFTLQIEFSDEIAQRFRRKRNDVFEVAGGTVQDLRRVDRRRDLWKLTVAPSSDAAVTIVVPADRACDAAGAVCTAGGDRLSTSVQVTVPGPPPTVSIAAGTSPVTEGDAATFTLARTGDTAAALTVALRLAEDGAVLFGTPASEAEFGADSATTAFSVSTENDEVVEAASLVTVSIEPGTGYTVDAAAGSAAVTVEDDDAAPALTGASVDGTALALSFDKALDENSTPDSSAFAVTVERASRTVDSVAVSGSSVTLTLVSAVEADDVVTVSFTVQAGATANLLQDAAGNAAAGFSDQAVTNETVASNAAPTGLPTVAGTVRVGERLTADASGIADADGLTNATFAWQWMMNDGATDTDIAGATAARHTLTTGEVGKTIKVRVTFTDDDGTEETLTSAATAAVVESVEPTISIAAGTSPLTEGEAATFTVERTGNTAVALTVALGVTEDGAVLSGTPATEVEFNAGSTTAALSVATEDDGTAEADGRVTAAVTAGSGYVVDADAGTASVDVYDNDRATTAAPAETLWSSTLAWADMGGGWLIAYAQDFSNPRWSEDGHSFSIWYIAYDSANGELWLQLGSEMPAGGIPEPAELTLRVDAATVEPGDVMTAFAAGSPGIAPGVQQGWSAGESVAVGLTRTVDAEGIAVSDLGISVGDARVQEAAGAVLSFLVTLDAAPASTVSVRYATSDGTAVSGADYEAVSGALRFEEGETRKTVSVPVMDDTHNEGPETLTLTLSDPFGAALAAGEATGTIDNTGPMPQAWITRFGRTVAQQAVDAIGHRLAGTGDTGGAHVAIGGVEFVGAGASGANTGGASASGAYAGAPLGEPVAGWSTAAEDLERFDPAENGRRVSGRELLLGSSFRFGTGGEDGAPSWTAWGRFATGSFEGEDGSLSLSGDVTTGFLGADISWERWLAGVALGTSEGEGAFDDGAGGSGGTAKSSLKSVYPYARYDIGDGVDIRGLVGMGSGDLRLVVGEEVMETDLSMRMGAAGLRGTLVSAAESGDLDLALKTDGFWVRTESDAARSSTGGNLEAASGTASRLRVALEGAQDFATATDAIVTPTLDLGLRHDSGDAETGTGVEAGLGLRYAQPLQGLTVEARVRGLLSHTDDGYEEWGASGSIRLDPGTAGRGVSLSITPAWGAASGGVDRLWATRPAAGLLADTEPDRRTRLQAELGFGLRPPLGNGVFTPYAGFSMAGEGDGRTYRLGSRWRGATAFHMALEASHGWVDEAATPWY